jgi:amylosucrase
VILTIGGIPLIYLGDEIGTLNDYSFREDPAKLDDSRWVHRSKADPEQYALRGDKNSNSGRIYQNLKHLIDLRKSSPAVGGSAPEFINTGNSHVFGYIRRKGNQQILFLNNFSEETQNIAGNTLRLYGLGYQFKDLVQDETIDIINDLQLNPFQTMWLVLIK